jgi:hypothetical protein
MTFSEHLPVSRQIFPLAARRFSVAVVVVVCILVNSLIPRYIIEQYDYGVLSQILVNQAVLLHVFALPNLSVKIMRCLFAERTSFPCETTKSPSRDRTKNSANTASDYRLAGFDNRADNGKVRAGPQLRDGCPGIRNVFAKFETLRVILFIDGSVFRSIISFFLAMLLFQSLPRSGIDEAEILSGDIIHTVRPGLPCKPGFLLYRALSTINQDNFRRVL